MVVWSLRNSFTASRISLISLTDAGHDYIRDVAGTFEEAVRDFFIEPLDADDIAALARIWRKLEAAGG